MELWFEESSGESANKSTHNQKWCVKNKFFLMEAINIDQV